MITYSSYRSAKPISLPGVIALTCTQGVSVVQLTIEITKSAGGAIQLDWGDGNIVTLSNTSYHTHYTSNYLTGSTTYNIRIYDDLDLITLFTVFSTTTLFGSVNQFRKLINLKTLDFGAALISGNLNKVRSGLEYIKLYGVMNYTGSINDLPTSLKSVLLHGTTNDMITGDLGLLWEGLKYFQVYSWDSNARRVIGDISHLPSTLIQFGVNGVDITGNINTLPAIMKDFSYEKSVGPTNPVTGNLDNLPAGLEVLFIVCYPNIEEQTLLTGTIAGLPRGLKFIILASCTQMTGDIADLPSGINQTLWISDNLRSRGIIGDIADLPTEVTQLSLAGHDLSGNIEELPSDHLIGCYISDNGGDITISAGAMPSLSLITSSLGITIQEGWSTAEVDAFLIAWAATASNNACTCTLSGGLNANQARSAASNAAVATLQGLNKTILTNP